MKTIFLLLLYAVTKVSSDDPIVRITATDPPLHPVDNAIVQYKDKDVLLTCVVENKPPNDHVQWSVQTKNSSLVRISTATQSHDPYRWAIDNPSPTAWRLRIQNVQIAEEGIYTCAVQVVSQNYNEDSRELRVVQTPQISDLLTSSDMTKDSDDTATFECYSTGHPAPIIKWSRLAGELLPNGGTEYQGNVLFIKQVKSEHAGIYKCTTINSAGSDERQIQLTVNFAPEVYAATGVVKQAVGYLKELVCNIKGYPQPLAEAIAWSREGQAIFNTHSRYEIRNIRGATNRITSMLIIPRVQQGDYGTFRCSASNDKGTQYSSVELVESLTPTPSLSGRVESSSPTFTFSLVTLGMMLASVLLLHLL